MVGELGPGSFIFTGTLIVVRKYGVSGDSSSSTVAWRINTARERKIPLYQMCAVHNF